MEFKKLRKKLSAILCSAMMVGGSNISNHVAMAGGIILQGDMGEITKYDNTMFEDNEVDDWGSKFMVLAKNNNKITLGNEEKSEEFNGYLYEFTVKHGVKMSSKVGLYLLANNGFAISLNDDTKFGVLPFSYFVYLMKKVNITLENFKSFDNMDKDIKARFLDIIRYAFLGTSDSPSEDYEDAREWFVRAASNVKPDSKEFGEFEDEDIGGDNKKHISIDVIERFKKANPKFQDGTSVFGPQVASHMVVSTTDANQIFIDSENNDNKEVGVTDQVLRAKGKMGLRVRKSKKRISPLWLIPGMGVPSIIVGGIIVGALANKHKEGDSKINDTRKEVSNKVFLGKKRGFNTSENAKTMVANKTSNNRRNANPRPNQRKSLDNRGFKRVKKQGL